MWIINKYGVAINTDCVARFRPDSDGDVVADLQGVAPVTASTMIGDTTVREILTNIISGTKIMEVK